MDILPGEELTYDYGMQFVMNYLNGQCLCGSVNCIAWTAPVAQDLDNAGSRLPVPYWDTAVLQHNRSTMTPLQKDVQDDQ